MRKLVLATMIAFAATAAVTAPTQAQIIFQPFGGDEGDGDYYDGYGDGYYVPQRQYDTQDYYGDQYYREPYRRYHRYHRHHRCHTTVITHWRHHHRVIERYKVCR